MKFIGKYEFNSLEQAESKINALPSIVDEYGNSHPAHRHTIVKIGFIVIENGTYNEEGDVLTEPVLNNKYSVDVLWVGLESHPYGWSSYSIDLDNEGSHSFLGVSYTNNKL